MKVIDKFVDFYRTLSLDDVDKLGDIYHENVRFLDPVAEHQGLEDVKAYFAKLMTNTEQCTFEVHCVSQANAQTFISWTMLFRHKRLKKGKDIRVEGMTELLHDNNKITFHRDYYDLGQLMYENIPIFGSFICWLKNRLSQ